jgi:hypothetical protein
VWEVTLGTTAAFRPREREAVASTDGGRVPLEFAVSSLVPAMKLLYLPAEIAWVNRSADLLEVTEAGVVVDVLEATSAETLLPGDSYRVRSNLAAPLAGDLRHAGSDYPAWVENRASPAAAGFPAAHRSAGPPDHRIDRQPVRPGRGDHVVAAGEHAV